MKYISFIIALFLIASCIEQKLEADSVLQSLLQSGVSGEIHFLEKNGLVEVSGSVFGLEPLSRHAFHIHEFGDCGNNGENAGEHFNPLGTVHGKFGVPPHHAGDFPQLISDEDGTSIIDFTADSFRLSEDPSVIGKALIIHRSEDKYTQPSGNAGVRIACGIIRERE
jgi:Cu-Zn family superoxide dismutase